MHLNQASLLVAMATVTALKGTAAIVALQNVGSEIFQKCYFTACMCLVSSRSLFCVIKLN